MRLNELIEPFLDNFRMQDQRKNTHLPILNSSTPNPTKSMTTTIKVHWSYRYPRAPEQYVCQLIHHSASSFKSSPTGQLKFKMSQGSEHGFAKNAHMKGYKDPSCFRYSSHSLWVFDVVYTAKLYKLTGPKCHRKGVIKTPLIYFPFDSHICTSHARKYL